MSDAVSVGDVAPNFSMPGDGGKSLSLADYAGQYLVLYFYPKDSTPGCTTEAKDFTANLDKFHALNAEIVGVSRDSVKKHENFIAKQELGIALGSDEDGEICNAYGVWVEKKNYGRTYMGIQRSTFLIGPDGKILEVWRNVRVKGHAETVLTSLQEHSSAT